MVGKVLDQAQQLLAHRAHIRECRRVTGQNRAPRGSSVDVERGSAAAWDGRPSPTGG
jgi:hypothetical protein